MVVDAEGTKEFVRRQRIDYVQLEVEQMLSIDIPVVPCLVLDAAMPHASELPESMQGLATRQGIPLRPEPHFNQDMEALFERLRPYGA